MSSAITPEDAPSPADLATLIGEAKKGDSAALTELLETMSPRLRRFAFRLCGHVGDDALQEALLTLSSKLDQFRDEANIYSWAFTLVRTACGRQTRGLENAPKVPLSSILALPAETSDVLGPERDLLFRERAEILNCALSTLSEDQRAAVLIRDVEGLKAEEAAEVLGLSVPALKSRLHRGRKALADALSGDTAPRGCPDVISSLSREHEGELSSESCRELSRHLQECSGCSERCARLKKLLTMCRETPTSPE